MLSVVVQAGGESRRMGQDKALLPFLGRPLIQRILERVAPIADELLVTTNHPEAFEFLNIPRYPDLIPGRGALGGLYTALSVAQHSLVAVAACDMPFVSRDLLSAERDLLIATEADAVIPQLEGGTEPFHAVYRRTACLPAIHSVLEAGKWRVDAWFPSINLRFLSQDEVSHYDPRLIAFWNLNTPEEFHLAEQMALEIEQPGV